MMLLYFIAVVALLAGAEGCSEGFASINNECFSFHTGEAMSWENALAYCKNGTTTQNLAMVKKANTLRGIYEYIQTYSMRGSFWIGGSDLTSEDDWLWMDTTRIERGTPFWALTNSVIGGYDHEPSGGTAENCLALDEVEKYYFNDLACDSLFHPICQE